MTHSVITSKGQITIPRKIREQFNLKKGDRIDFNINDGILQLIPASKKVSDVFGILSRKPQKSISIDDMNSKLLKSFKNKKI